MSRRGAVVVLLALCLTGLIGIVAIAIDGGLLQDERRRVQAAAGEGEDYLPKETRTDGTGFLRLDRALHCGVSDPGPCAMGMRSSKFVVNTVWMALRFMSFARLR